MDTAGADNPAWDNSLGSSDNRRHKAPSDSRIHSPGAGHKAAVPVAAPIRVVYGQPLQA